MNIVLASRGGAPFHFAARRTKRCWHGSADRAQFNPEVVWRCSLCGMFVLLFTLPRMREKRGDRGKDDRDSKHFAVCILFVFVLNTSYEFLGSL